MYRTFAFVLIAIVSIFGKFGLGNANLCDNSFPWNDARLPAFAHPIHYDLLLHPNLTTFTFDGRVTVLLFSEGARRTDFLVLNSANLNIEKVTLRDDKNSIFNVTVHQCESREQLAVMLDHHLQPGIQYNLTIDFGGNLTDALKGLYRSSYKDVNGEKRYIAITQFSPTDARRMFPCWDEPTFKATFSTSIARDANMISLANMPLQRSVRGNDGTVVDHFEKTLNMSTYLIAIAVLDFPRKTKVATNGVEISLYAPELQINQTEHALQAAADALVFHEKYLKIGYPLKKMDIVAVGDFAFGAMENWGLMTFRDTIILYDEEKATTLDEDSLITVVSHETGHQWFGNLATMKWWSDLWLKEGFARFLENFAAAKIRPDWGLLDLFGVNVISVGFDLDGLNTTHSVNVPVQETSEIRGIFDAISYNKGASIIYMLLSIFGEEKLANGLREYLQTYKYSNADGAEFWKVLEKHIDATTTVQLDQIADTWTMQPGYPYLTVNLTDTHILIKQNRFYYLKHLRDDSNKQKWTIPFTFMENGISRLVWINDTETNISISAPVTNFKANVNGTGFYRVLYEPSVWNNISLQLAANQTAFSTTDRANLLIDGFGFGRAGLLDVTVSLGLVYYLHQETEYAPWQSALVHYEKLVGLYASDKDVLKAMQGFVSAVLEQSYKKINWTLQYNHKDKRFAARIISAACYFEMKDCKKQAMDVFKLHVATGKRIVPDILYVIISEVIKTDSATYWDIVWEKYISSNSPTEKSVFLRALCQTPDQEKLKWLLNEALKAESIRPNFLATLAQSIVANPNNGQQLVWQFTTENWPRIYKLTGGTAVLGYFITNALANFGNSTELEQVKTFFNGREMGGAKRSLEQAIENILVNIQFKNINGEKLRVYLNSFHSSRGYEILC